MFLPAAMSSWANVPNISTQNGERHATSTSSPIQLSDTRTPPSPDSFWTTSIRGNDCWSNRTISRTMKLAPNEQMIFSLANRIWMRSKRIYQRKLCSRDYMLAPCAECDIIIDVFHIERKYSSSSNDEDRPPASEELFFDQKDDGIFDELAKTTRYAPLLTKMQRNLLRTIARYVFDAGDNMSMVHASPYNCVGVGGGGIRLTFLICSCVSCRLRSSERHAWNCCVDTWKIWSENALRERTEGIETLAPRNSIWARKHWICLKWRSCRSTWIAATITIKTNRPNM